MKRLTFSIAIHAPKEKVWYSLWDEENYQDWTSAFCEGSFVISDWNEGSKIYFLSSSGDGMNSKIVLKRPFETMVFQHVGEIANYEEQPITNETQSWSGSEERYDLSENNGVTTVKVSVDVVEKYTDYFNDAFPKALERVKNLAESDTKSITVKTTLETSLEEAWENFTQPGHIVHWNFASPDWHCPKAENHLETGKDFTYTMAAKDGSVRFDFTGIYQEVIPLKKIVYTIADGRKVTVKFDRMDRNIIVTENFQPENQNPVDLQRGGWQAILDNFKKYTEQ